jgi:peptidoglycan hydrolase CwlO-like protein
MQERLKDRDTQIMKLDTELKDIKGKRDVLKKEMEDRIKSEEAKHEKELEKLCCELARLQ